jgi:hypothetical protein
MGRVRIHGARNVTVSFACGILGLNFNSRQVEAMFMSPVNVKMTLSRDEDDGR